MYDYVNLKFYVKLKFHVNLILCKIKTSAIFWRSQNFVSSNSRVKQEKDLHRRICEKPALAHDFWNGDQYFKGLRPRTALQWHRVCYFLWGTILAWGHSFRLGGTSSDLGGGTTPECLSWRRAKAVLYLSFNLLARFSHHISSLMFQLFFL